MTRFISKEHWLPLLFMHELGSDFTQREARGLGVRAGYVAHTQPIV